MFFTLGIIIGFVLGWFINDKWDWVKKRAVFWKKDMFGSIRLVMVGLLITGIAGGRLCDEVKIRQRYSKS